MLGKVLDCCAYMLTCRLLSRYFNGIFYKVTSVSCSQLSWGSNCRQGCRFISVSRSFDFILGIVTSIYPSRRRSIVLDLLIDAAPPPPHSKGKHEKHPNG